MTKRNYDRQLSCPTISKERHISDNSDLARPHDVIPFNANTIIPGLLHRIEGTTENSSTHL